MQNGTIPLTTALEIARAKHDDENLGDMLELEEVYKTGQLKGHQIPVPSHQSIFIRSARLARNAQQRGPERLGTGIPHQLHQPVSRHNWLA